MSRVWSIARNAVAEAIRRKVIVAFMVAAMILILISLVLASFSPREEITMIKSFSFFVITIVGFLVTLILSIQAVPQELDKRTIYTILSKPVKRSEYIFGKFLGAAITLLIMVAIMGCTLAVMVMSKGMFDQVLPVLAVAFATYLMLLILCAVGIMFSVIVSPFLNFVIVLVLFLFGLLSGSISSMANNPQSSAVTRAILKGIQWVMPNLGSFSSIQQDIIHPEAKIAEQLNWAWYMSSLTVYAVCYAAILVFLAIYWFERKEV
jgi:ABC-type transport system involved in multi-copper enzyme maturation permease subunit